jgi:hypothetical protein
MLALSLEIGADELDGFSDAVGDFVQRWRPLLSS